MPDLSIRTHPGFKTHPQIEDIQFFHLRREAMYLLSVRNESYTSDFRNSAKSLQLSRQVRRAAHILVCSLEDFCTIPKIATIALVFYRQ